MTSCKITFLKAILLLIGLGMIAALVGCSSSSSQVPPPAITVTLSSTPASLVVSGTLSITATVANDSTNAGVTWSCAPGNSASTCGSFSSATSPSGTAVTYTAPASPASVTITATSVADTAISNTSPSITITAAPPVITVTLSTTPTSMYVNDYISVTATVANDSTNAGVTWSCSGMTPCGTFSSATSASGAPVTYTAPASTGTVTITATSVANTAISKTSPSITINPTSGYTVTLSTPPPATMPTLGMASIAATTTDPAGVTWSCAPANSCGTFSSGSSASGTSVTYTAPAAAGTVTITASSVSDDAISASATVTITTSVATTLAAGNYVFSLAGTDNSPSGIGPYFYAGAFAVNSSGAITGEQDFSDAYDFVRGEAITSGSITATSDGNLLITLNFTDIYINGGAGTVTLDASLVSASKALLTEYDNWATSTGELDLQAARLSAPSGGYAFFAAGGGKYGAPISIGGVIDVDGSGTISGTGSVFDINDACATKVDGTCTAAVYPDQTLTANDSTVVGPDSYGLVTFELNSSCSLCTGTSVASIVLDGYMVDANHIRLIENWYNDDLSAFTGGTALGQTGTGTFSSISGTYVIGTAGADTNVALQVAGVLTFNSDGSVSGNLSFNDIAAQSPQGGTALAAESTTTPCSSGLATTACYTIDAPGTGNSKNIQGAGRHLLRGLSALGPHLLDGR